MGQWGHSGLPGVPRVRRCFPAPRGCQNPPVLLGDRQGHPKLEYGSATTLGPPLLWSQQPAEGGPGGLNPLVRASGEQDAYFAHAPFAQIALNPPRIQLQAAGKTFGLSKGVYGCNRMSKIGFIGWFC